MNQSQRALALFDALVDLPPDARARALNRLLQEDPALHAHVRDLLAADGQPSMLEHSPGTLLGSRDDGVAESPDALLGQRIGPWRITGIVGRGGMGAVYRGERDDGEFQQQAAIKLIRLGMDQPRLRERFRRERQILAGLAHPGIATLLDGGVTDGGAPYFAMELIDGTPIDAWCDARNLGLEARARLFLQVCAAVQHAHQNLTVHRDLKPGNILVTDDGRTKLLDFGIAKLLQEGDEDNATQDRPLTPEFAAPEQLRGGTVTTATDIYALGVVLYGLFTGARLFPDGARPAVWPALAPPPRDPLPLARAAEKVGPALARARGFASKQALARALRGDLTAIVQRCLEEEPARRYASAEALASDLEAWLDGRPISTMRGDRLYRLHKFTRRHRWGVTASTLALLGIITASGAALWQAGVAHEQAALATTAAAAAQTSAARALDTKDFLVKLIAETDPLRAGKGTQLTAVDLLKAASGRVDSELAHAPDSQAELRVAIGTSLFSLGAIDDARRSIDDGIAQMQALAIHGPVLANALYERSTLRRQTDDSTGAERDALASLHELERAGGDQRLLLVKVRTNLATIAVSRGRYQEALDQLQAVLHDRNALLGADNPDTAVDWNNLGNAYLRLDRFPEAETAFQHAGTLLLKQGGPDHPRMVWLHLGIAIARSGQGDRIDDAEASFAEAERVLRKSLGAGHPVSIYLYTGRANLYLRQGCFARAETANRQALAFARATPGDLASQIQAQLGVSLMQQDRMTEAQAELEPAIAAMARERVASEPYLNRARSALAVVAFHRGQAARGERAIRDALARLEAADLVSTEDYAEIASDLANVLAISSRTTEARQWHARALALFTTVYGAAHPRTQREAATISAG